MEKLDRRAYQEAFEERISSKIGLANTYLDTGNTAPENKENLAYTYFGQWKEIPEINLGIPAGAGDTMSTPIDMVKFIRAPFNLKLVSKNSLERMITTRDREGMGMELFSFAGRTLYGHTGGSNASGAWMAYEPKEKLAMAYTTNAKIFKVSDIVARVFNIYWNRPYEKPTFETLVVRPEILDQYVGEYVRTVTDTKMRIIRTGQTIAIGNGANSIPFEATGADSIAPRVTAIFDVAKKI